MPTEVKNSSPFLAKLANHGPALELGIGAGRIALPLSARGIRVDGIDISPPTVAQMRSRPEGKRMSVVIGDFADVAVKGKYRLIYVVWNTFFNLPCQEAQSRCFENVAARLAAGGRFVVEAYVPSFLYRLRNDQYVEAESVEVDGVCLDVLRHDPARQMIEENHVRFSPSGVEFAPVVQRYAWPSELDLMARMAGLRLERRWGGWKGEAFGPKSEAHVSVYGRAPTAASRRPAGNVGHRATRNSRRRGSPRA